MKITNFQRLALKGVAISLIVLAVTGLITYTYVTYYSEPPQMNGWQFSSGLQLSDSMILHESDLLHLGVYAFNQTQIFDCKTTQNEGTEFNPEYVTYDYCLQPYPLLKVQNNSIWKLDSFYFNDTGTWRSWVEIFQNVLEDFLSVEVEHSEKPDFEAINLEFYNGLASLENVSEIAKERRPFSDQHIIEFFDEYYNPYFQEFGAIIFKTQHTYAGVHITVDLITNPLRDYGIKVFITVVPFEVYKSTDSDGLRIGIEGTNDHYTRFYMADSPSFFPQYISEVNHFLETII